MSQGPLPVRVVALPCPRRSGAAVAVHVRWSEDDAPEVAAELLAWVRRARALGCTVHVDVVTSWVDRAAAALCAASLQLQPLALLAAARACPSGTAGPRELCAQLRLEGAGARVVCRARRRTRPFRAPGQGGRGPDC